MFSEHLLSAKHTADASWKMMPVRTMTGKRKPRSKFPVPGPAIVRSKREPGKFLEELEFELGLLGEI